MVSLDEFSLERRTFGGVFISKEMKPISPITFSVVDENLFICRNGSCRYYIDPAIDFFYDCITALLIEGIICIPTIAREDVVCIYDEGIFSIGPDVVIPWEDVRDPAQGT